MNGKADELDLFYLPKIPWDDNNNKKKRFVEILKDWEVQYGPHRFSYKDLFKATKGFKEKEVLGKGGFGRVYKDVLPSSNVQIAVKRISHDSR
ncbi:hypothetical protein GOBAR_DD29651 [Gossypium barbadense]|nr:hypothetical protein GOBAR_DD29651 [Gossypium barbadense]